MINEEIEQAQMELRKCKADWTRCQWTVPEGNRYNQIK
jgi:hypothetical protein